MVYKEMGKARKSQNIFSYVKEKDKEGREGLTQTQVVELMARRNTASSEMLEWKTLLQQAHHYATPNSNAWKDVSLPTVQPGENRAATVYDLTLAIAHRRFVSKMLMGMIPKGQQWLNFVPSEDIPENSPAFREAQLLSDKLGDIFFKFLDRSRFYLAASEAFSDASISTGFMTINHGTKERPFKFNSVSDALVMVEGDGEGGICGIYRDWKDLKAGRIPQIWNGAKMPANRQSKEKITVYECSYIDFEADESERYCYTVLTQNQEVLYHDRSNSWPWIYFRMNVLPGEIRGRGPSLEASPTAATINLAMHDEMVSAAFQANPMYMVASDSVFNTETFVARPGSAVPVQPVMGEWPIAPFPQAGNPSFTAVVISDLRQQINELLFTDPLGPVNGPEMTATESNIRFTENLESFSAMVPRFQAEFFDPVIKRCLKILFDLRPEILGDIDSNVRDQIIGPDGTLIGIQYETPLMGARGEIKVRKFMAYMQSMAGVLGPELGAATVNPVKVPGFLATNLGVEMELIKSEEEIQQMIDDANQQVQEQAQLDMAQQEQQIINE